MIKRVREIIFHPLFSGSAIMIVGSNLANFFAYIYHLVIGRMLGPSGYGELASIINLIGLFSVTFGFLGLVIMKFVSGSKKSDIPVFFNWVKGRALIAAAIVGTAVFLATPLLAKFLNSSSFPIALAGPILFVYFVGYIYRAFLQGLLEFGKVVIASNLDLLGRLILGVLFVFLGLGVFGGVLGIFVSSFLSLLLTVYFLKKYVKNGKSKRIFSGSKEIWAYSIPIFVMSISTNSMYMSDVILAKHFFDPHLSGIYASLSTLGRIIFYGTAPVSLVMFPLISKSFARGGNYKKIFFLSLLLTLVLCLGVLGIYYLFPELVIGMLYGSRFVEGAGYLVWFGGFMTIFTVNSLIINYFLSINITKPVYLFLFASIAQIVLIWFFHSSILEVVRVSFVISLVLLISLVIYLAYEAHLSRNPSLQGGKDNS